jgi:hypothetical protein
MKCVDVLLDNLQNRSSLHNINVRYVAGLFAVDPHHPKRDFSGVTCS